MVDVINDPKTLIGLFKYTEYDIRILKEALKQRKSFTVSEIQHILKCPFSTVNSALKRLNKKGFVKKRIRSAEWECIKNDELKKLILSHFEKLISYLYKS